MAKIRASLYLSMLLMFLGEGCIPFSDSSSSYPLKMTILRRLDSSVTGITPIEAFPWTNKKERAWMFAHFGDGTQQERYYEIRKPIGFGLIQRENVTKVLNPYEAYRTTSMPAWNHPGPDQAGFPRTVFVNNTSDTVSLFLHSWSDHTNELVYQRIRPDSLIGKDWSVSFNGIREVFTGDGTGPWLALMNTAISSHPRGTLLLDQAFPHAVLAQILTGSPLAFGGTATIDGEHRLFFGTNSPVNGTKLNGFSDDSLYTFSTNLRGDILWKTTLGGSFGSSRVILDWTRDGGSFLAIVQQAATGEHSAKTAITWCNLADGTETRRIACAGVVYAVRHQAERRFIQLVSDSGVVRWASSDWSELSSTVALDGVESFSGVIDSIGNHPGPFYVFMRKDAQAEVVDSRFHPVGVLPAGLARSMENTSPSTFDVDRIGDEFVVYFAGGESAIARLDWRPWYFWWLWRWRYALLLSIGFPALFSSFLFGSRYFIARRQSRRLEREYTANLRRLNIHQQNKDEATRKKIARDMHDHVGHLLVAANSLLEARLEGIHHSGDADETLATLRTDIHEIGRGIRDVIQELHPPILEHFGLVEAIRADIQKVEQATGILLECHARGRVPNLDPDQTITLYRCYQEAVNNAVKYAGATTITVVIESEGTKTSLVIQDDGVGFEKDHVMRKGGLGLLGMRERIEAFEGELEILSSPGTGTKISFSMPDRKRQVEEEMPGYDQRNPRR